MCVCTLYNNLISLILYVIIINKKILEEVPEVDEAEEVQGAIEDDKPAVKLGKSEERRWSVVAQKILMEAVVAGDSDETLNRLKKASDSLVGLWNMIAHFVLNLYLNNINY